MPRAGSKVQVALPARATTSTREWTLRDAPQETFASRDRPSSLVRPWLPRNPSLAHGGEAWSTSQRRARGSTLLRVQSPLVPLLKPLDFQEFSLQLQLAVSGCCWTSRFRSVSLLARLLPCPAASSSPDPTPAPSWSTTASSRCSDAEPRNTLLKLAHRPADVLASPCASQLRPHLQLTSRLTSVTPPLRHTSSGERRQQGQAADIGCVLMDEQQQHKQPLPTAIGCPCFSHPYPIQVDQGFGF